MKPLSSPRNRSGFAIERSAIHSGMYAVIHVKRTPDGRAAIRRVIADGLTEVEAERLAREKLAGKPLTTDSDDD